MHGIHVSHAASLGRHIRARQSVEKAHLRVLSLAKDGPLAEMLGYRYRLVAFED